MIDTKDQTPVMTLKQAAAYLQISKAHLSNVINGKVPDMQPLRCFRVGRRILIKREWVDEWMESADLEAIR
ncbi:MAG: helix-turn-helix domain-containing protein [Bryobacterales bacterium]|nr:helix-turn-helix domain-containing protein [Bryobacterales bacterium]